MLCLKTDDPAGLQYPLYMHSTLHININAYFIFQKVRQMLDMFCAKPLYLRRNAYEAIEEQADLQNKEI